MVQTQINPVEIKKYYRQYINNYKSFNMEFTEFICTKLNITEREAIQLVKESKTIIKNKTW